MLPSTLLYYIHSNNSFLFLTLLKSVYEFGALPLASLDTLLNFTRECSDICYAKYAYTQKEIYYLRDHSYHKKSSFTDI